MQGRDERGITDPSNFDEQRGGHGDATASSRLPAWVRLGRLGESRKSLVVVAGAFLALAGLLTLFEHVVAGAVADGELRRTAVAAQVQAVWRCKLRHELAERQKCLVQVSGL